MTLDEVNAVLIAAHRAVEAGRVSADEIAALRGALIRLRALLGEAPVERALKANARTLGTRLRDLARQMRRSDSEAATPATLGALQRREETRFGRRLKKHGPRLADAIAHEPEPVRYETETFRCKSDLDRCRRGSAGRFKTWCHLAMAICLLKGIVSVKVGV